jgi:hypothetical protein
MSDLLIAFDGSWAEDTYGPAGDDTNVGRAARRWHGQVLYEEGVGSRLGWLGKWLGGIFGLGLTARVLDLENNIRLWHARNPNGNLYGIGWSRGAVGLVHLANQLSGRGIAFKKLRLLDPVTGPFHRSWNTVNPGTPIRVIRAREPKRFFTQLKLEGDNTRTRVVDATHVQIGRDPRWLALMIKA